MFCRLHIIDENLRDFLVIAGIKSFHHAKNNSGAAVVVNKQLVCLMVDGKAFDFALERNVIKGALEDNSRVRCARLDINAIDVIWFMRIGGAVISCKIIGTLVIHHSLNPLWRALQVNLAQELAGFKAVLIKVAAAFFANPGAHPYGFFVRIYRESGAFFLAALRLKFKCAL